MMRPKDHLSRRIRRCELEVQAGVDWRVGYMKVGLHTHTYIYHICIIYYYTRCVYRGVAIVCSGKS